MVNQKYDYWPTRQPEAKPTEISAREFVEQDYASKIAAGECEVTHKLMMESPVVKDVYRFPYASKVTGSDYEIQYIDAPNDPCGITPDEPLTVRWLDTAKPASEPAALLSQTVDTVRYGTPEFEQLSREDCEREVERLKAELADAQAENKRLRTTVEAAQEWAHMGDDVGFDEAVMVCDALMEAVFKYEQALNAVADGGSGSGEG